MPTPQELERSLMERLEALGIETTTHRHPPVRTVEEAKALRGSLDGRHIKNLFLRDKKRTMWLLTVQEDREVDLKALRRQLGAKGNLSFGKAELLGEALGVEPGAVTPFAVMNDADGRVTMVLEGSVLDGGPINAHPLHNEATTSIEPADLMRFLEACDHAPLLLSLDG
jgi:Ala-tRNA(Pro) deacylase